jgi:hypothetical protein
MAPTSLARPDQATDVSRPGTRPRSAWFTALLWVQGLYYLVRGFGRW